MDDMVSDREPKKYKGLSENDARFFYVTEKELADRLRNASAQDRKILYPVLYDELFRRVPFARAVNKWEDDQYVKLARAHEKMRLIGRYISDHGCVFAEVGPGDCSLSVAMTQLVAKVYAIEVSQEAVGRQEFPDNFELILSDGLSVPLPKESVDIVFSAHLMEHLHPDDAGVQLNNIFLSIKPGGVYICITPNRLSGPHDSSKYFSDVAEGFHLKEYSNKDLARLFFDAGFTEVSIFMGGKGVYVKIPLVLMNCIEAAVDAIPVKLRRFLFGGNVGRALLGVIMVGKK